jgi:hypothetical protein
MTSRATEKRNCQTSGPCLRVLLIRLARCIPNLLVAVAARKNSYAWRRGTKTLREREALYL